MATNGNEQQPMTVQQQANQTLAQMLRKVDELPTPSEADATYDLVVRMRDNTRAMRDLADYSNKVADDLERIILAYVSNMQRLLGKVGK